MLPTSRYGSAIREYGGSGSAPSIVISSSGARLRSVSAATTPAGPLPMIRCLISWSPRGPAHAADARLAPATTCTAARRSSPATPEVKLEAIEKAARRRCVVPAQVDLHRVALEHQRSDRTIGQRAEPDAPSVRRLLVHELVALRPVRHVRHRPRQVAQE